MLKIAAGASLLLPVQAAPGPEFTLEEPIRKPVPVPREVLSAIRDHELVRPLLQNGSVRPGELSGMLRAASVHLNADGRADLVVKSEDARLWGANVGPFWVFRNTLGGYRLVLAVSTLSLELLSPRGTGYRDLRTVSASARRTFTRTYRFDGRRYQPH